MEVYKMLVLTRRVEEGIMIGDDVRVRVLEIKGHQVKIGIEAPRQTGVYREEIFLRIQEENRRTGATPKNPGILDVIAANIANALKRKKR
ncbi:MAG TPA: carbon storage regulator CsrA [Patescibacteria group bacterium]|nr:carbon storage regulator CsrA [Patescibacteria group bacterium]